ncbi:MAG: hypothetical protein AAF889_05035 [Cyanobacteria bacterium P01_D01_bin.73]
MGQRTAFFGAGELLIIDPARNKVCVTPAASISLTSEAENLEARGLVGGKSQIVATEIGSETHTLTASFEAIGKDVLQLLLGQEEEVVPELTLPRHAELIVPDDGNYAYPGMTAATEVMGTVEGMGGYHLTTVDGAPQPGEMQRTADALVFNAEEAGKAVGIAVYKTYNNIKTIGLNETTRIGSGLQISFTLYAGGIKQNIFIPQASVQSRPTFAATGEVSATEAVFSVQQAPGYALPYLVSEVA